MTKHKKQYEKQNNAIKKLKLILIIFIIAVVCISIVSVLARYITRNQNHSLMASKEFYFNSDKLTEEGSEYEIDNWSGVEDYTITINMNSLDNNLNKATYDIPYSISYTSSSNIICQLSKESGIIYASSNSDAFTLQITPNAVFENGDEVWVEIHAVSEAEYQKELYATFKLTVGKENVTYQIDDTVGSSYFELNITNTQSYYVVDEAFNGYVAGQRIDINTYLNLSDENKAKCHSGEITLSFDPNEVRMDMTDSNYLNAETRGTQVINGYEYINEIVIKIDALSSENVRFYKIDKSKDYTYPLGSNDSVIDVSIR